MRPTIVSVWGGLVLAALLPLFTSPVRAGGEDRAKLLVLPWMVIDRETNRECDTQPTAKSPASREAQALGLAAQAALDSAMHDLGKVEPIPRREWEPTWKTYRPGQLVRQGPGCAVCTPVGQLLRFDPAALQQLASGVGADYVWMGVAVTPLTRAAAGRTDECCREALARERSAVLVRGSALLVRVSDGSVVWQRDARRLESDVPARVGKVARTPEARRQMAAKGVARLLGHAFAREHPNGLAGAASAAVRR